MINEETIKCSKAIVDESPCCTPGSENTSCCAPDETVAKSCCSNDNTDINADTPATRSSSCCDDTPSTSQKSRLTHLLEPVRSAWSLIILLPLLVLVLDRENFGEMIQIATSALAGTAPYIVFAVLLLAYLKASQAENMVSEAFKGRENRMILLAALFGGLAPFCSCEVIPFIAGLLALGAPVSAVMAFWLSSPLIDPPSLMITAGALGWEFAIGKALAAVFLGLFGGFGVKYLMHTFAFQNPLKNHTISGCDSGTCGVEKPFSGHPNWTFWRDKAHRQVFAEQGLENALFLFKWLSLAYLLEALLILYVPASLIGGLVGGDGFGSIVTGALVGMPAYLNSYAAPPLVAGLMEQGMSIGSAMAFMVAGAISSIPAMTAVWSLVKKPVFAAYLGFGVGGAILFGSGFAAIMSL